MSEPITVDEAKLFMRIDEDYTYDDFIIATMIAANREYLEGELGLSLIPKTGLKYKYTRPCCGQSRRMYLPYGPVSNVVAKAVSDDSIYELTEVGGDENYPVFCPTTSVNITYDAGDWGDNFPQGLKLALLMLTATHYENRENFVVGQTVTPVTQNAMDLAWKFSRNLYL